jgi:pimeloyl-ACP methyl ester carboxylesterase
MTAQERTASAPEVQWRLVHGAWVRSLWFRPPGGDAPRVPAASPRGTVLIVPGLGLPRYTLPLAQVLAARGVATVVFDALAWRGRGRRVAPTIGGLGAACAHWLDAFESVHSSSGRAGEQARAAGTPDAGRVVIVGHSTGAQVALEAVLRRQGNNSGTGLALVMAGPTFAPAQRTLGGLVRPALTAYRKDTPKELVVLKDLLRVRTDVVRLVASALRHRPEERVGQLRVPLFLTAGEADSFAPQAWLRSLAAVRPARVTVLPGSHNNVFTARQEFASVVLEALAEAAGTG